MTKVIIRDNVLDSIEDQEFDVPAVCTFLYEYFDIFPETARIFHNKIDIANEIELRTATDVDNLNKLKGTVYVIIEPAVLYLASAVSIYGAVSQLSGKKKKTGTKKKEEREIPETQSNNKLTARGNTERINERIPDIFGTVKAFPDLIAQPYRYYSNNREVEHSYMCIGRGKYEISDIRDGEDFARYVTGFHYQVFDPFTSPNSGFPVLQQGSIIDPLIETRYRDGAPSQKLWAPNDEGYESKVLYANFYPTFGGAYNKIQVRDEEEWPIYKPIGSTITIAAPFNVVYVRRITQYAKYSYSDWFPYSSVLYDTLDLSGTYTISGYTDLANGYKLATLTAPEVVNSDWQVLKDIWGYIWGMIYGESGNSSPPPNPRYIVNSDNSIASNQASLYAQVVGPNRTVGPFIFEAEDTGLIVNFTAAGGVFYDDGITQTAASIQIDMVFQNVDGDDIAYGPTVTVSHYVVGSATERNDIGSTYWASLPESLMGARIAMSMYRVTPKATRAIYPPWYPPDPEPDPITYTNQEDIEFDSLYSYRPVTQLNFGDVTTIRTLVYANDNKITVNNRKLNCNASRIIDTLVDGEYVSGTTSKFADIARWICLDPKIGNRTEDELDVDNFYDTYNDVITYFGTVLAGEFNITFDDNDITFEETISILAEAVFCSVFRQGNVIRFSFEKETENSTILFNHRNKIPGTEKRSVSFGYLEEKDGVELEYIDDIDGIQKIVYEPYTETAINPEQVSQLGVVHRLIAYLHAKRIHNRQLYQNIAIEFDATQEAQLLGINERIQVADNTRPNTFDGEVISQDGLTLTLSQPFLFDMSKTYTIFLQNVDGTIQGIAITAGATKYEVILASSTNFPLALDLDLFARATYEIVEDSSTRKQTFLVQEKDTKDNFIVNVKAVNYDARYYQNDLDYANGVVDAFGYVIP